jgi:metal-responsive CopG/Arc/MetJ family transcriptional regulator
MTELANSRDAFITVRVPRRLVDQLDHLAERELISRSDFVRRELLLAARAADRESVSA